MGMVKRLEEKSYLVKAEGNFEDHPYFRVGDSKGSEGILSYEQTIRTRDGHELKQRWTVRAAQGMGLPGKLDQDVYVGLLQLIDRKGEVPDDGWIQFSLYELMEFLGRDHHGGRDYRQVKESLERMSLTGIQSINAFYNKSTQSYVTDTFHLLERVVHSEAVDGGGRRAERTRVKLSQHLVESYKADYLKGLDADFYWSLNSGVARRLYRLIDKKRNNHRRWECEIFALRDRIPLSNYAYPSKVKEKLAPAHGELLDKGFLENVTFRKLGRKETLVCYEIREGFAQRRPVLQLEPTPENRIAIERLKAEGVQSDVASSLVADHGPERCLRYAEALPFQKNVRNRPGWLRRAIEHGYDLDLPPGAKIQPTLDLTQEATGEMGEGGGTPTAVAPEPDPTALEAWQEVLEGLSTEGESNSSQFHAWFVGSVPTALEADTLALAVPNDFAKQYIETRFQTALEASLSAYLGTPSRLSVHVAPAARTPEPASVPCAE
jgi:plasmid replication initiation protein